MSHVLSINVVEASLGSLRDRFGRNAPLREPMMNANGISHDSLYFNEDSLWQNNGAPAAESLQSTPLTPLYSPQFNGYTTPSSDSSGLKNENHYDSNPMEQNLASYSPYHGNSPALSTTPFDSLLGTPESIPSDAQIMAHISHTRNDGISHPERPQVCVDTSLLFSSQSNYPDNRNFPSVQDLSPGLLSPFSASHDIGPPPQTQLSRRHSHSRSEDGGQVLSLGNEFSVGAKGRGRGLQRVRSAPTSRQHSPYKRPNKLPRAAGNTRSISPIEVGQVNGSDPFYTANTDVPASPSGSIGRSVVATDRIRAASTARRQNPPICRCDECGHTFTTNFAKDRHMNSHTGERRFVCTVPGCNQRFPTDSGRKRHQKSKTLHVS